MNNLVECYVLDDLSLDDHIVHCQIVKEEQTEFGILLYIRAMEENDSSYNTEYEDGIGLFWKIIHDDDKRIMGE